MTSTDSDLELIPIENPQLGSFAHPTNEPELVVESIVYHPDDSDLPASVQEYRWARPSAR